MSYCSIYFENCQNDLKYEIKPKLSINFESENKKSDKFLNRKTENVILM